MTTKFVCLVTGASRGIGSALAQRLGSLHPSVTHLAITARSEQDLNLVKNQIPSQVKTLVIPADLANPEAPKHIINETISNFGQIDCVVHGAGTLGEIKPLSDQSMEHITSENYQQSTLFKTFQINLLSVMQVTHFAIPHLQKTNGRVIFISSGAAAYPTYAWSTYCVTKSGMNMLCSCLALEEKDITFLSVRPGVVDTKMQKELREQGKEGMQSEDYDKFIKYHETGQLKSPDDVAKKISSLCLYSPKEWSGRFVSLEDKDVETLYAQKFSTNV
jgi:NAD(P)-dependent dehydrogenase (short-subunit alcohol dehydrogenase family)